MTILLGIVLYVLLIAVMVAMMSGNRSDDEMHERVVQRMRGGVAAPEEPLGGGHGDTEPDGTARRGRTPGHEPIRQSG
jgi:hypothetical protein